MKRTACLPDLQVSENFTFIHPHAENTKLNILFCLGFDSRVSASQEVMDADGKTASTGADETHASRG